MNMRMTASILSVIFLTLSGFAAADVDYPAGSTINAILNNEVNTKTAQDGQRFTMTTASGSTIYGHLMQVVRATPTRKAHVKFTFDFIQFPDGTRTPIHASLLAISQKKQTSWVQAAGQAVGGMIIGNIVGKAVGTNVGGAVGLAGGALLAANTSYNIDIPAGAAARIVLNRPLVSGHPQAR